MPTINTFYQNEADETKLSKLIPDLKKYAAEQLTCGDIKLSSDEISVRLIKSNGKGMLAPVELEITAAAFKERVDRQDEICLNIQKFLKDQAQTDAKVWLILAELGHSWD